MSTKSNQTPKKKSPKSNKKLKRDKTTIIENKAQENNQTKTSIISNSEPEKAQNENNEHHQEEEEEEEGNDDANIQDETTTQSFAERLKILNLQSDASDRLIEANDSETESKDEQKEEENGRKMLKAPKKPETAGQGSTNQSKSMNGTQAIMPVASIGSFAQTLTQALKSADTQLLESCFLRYESKKNHILIANTIQRLPKSLLHNLIQQLIICLNRKKRGYGDGLTTAPVKRTRALIEWVRQILIVHLSYLLTIPSLVTQLTTLHASLQKRLNLHTKLLSLNGRLELVLNQIELKKVTKERNIQMNAPGARAMNAVNANKTKNSSVSKSEPFKYVEGQSSESEAQEDARGKSKEDQPSISDGDGDGDDNDDESSDEDEENDDKDEDEVEVGSNGSNEGSVEEVVLGVSGSSDENSDESDADQSGEKLGNQFDDLLDLEAEESQSELGDHEDSEDSEEEEDDEADEDDSINGFIDDGTVASQEGDSDSE